MPVQKTVDERKQLVERANRTSNGGDTTEGAHQEDDASGNKVNLLQLSASNCWLDYYTSKLVDQYVSKLCKGCC